MDGLNWSCVIRKDGFTTTSLPLKIAELNVFLAPLLLSEERTEGIQFGFGRVALAGNVHLVVAAVDEVGGDGRGQALGAWRRGHEAQADMALQSIAVGAAGGCSGQLTVAVDGLPPPWPQVQLCVVVLQDEHDEPAEHSLLALLQQRLAAEKVSVLSWRSTHGEYEIYWRTKVEIQQKETKKPMLKPQQINVLWSWLLTVQPLFHLYRTTTAALLFLRSTVNPFL